jgi:hypothetical protein
MAHMQISTEMSTWHCSIAEGGPAPQSAKAALPSCTFGAVQALAVPMRGISRACRRGDRAACFCRSA